MAISFDAALGIHPQALLVRTKRAEVLANNIANADTPNYKARDIDFRAVLAAQNASDVAPVKLDVRRNGHQSGLVNPDLAAELLYRNPTQPSVDGNTVDMQREQAEYAQNAMAFQASFIFLNRKFSGLLSAIKGE
ncbi:flagellar basal body rod protein FlgB [Motiliproteus sediminis]|uniref:flagellar basal body rod protein FlgB n=1 Tax=Motiliproteus sediminis TaxID=1468178 RepID=UPI001AEF84EA|nr:flagellar basal body rod protein FlgB [Motiliproteus sediminis]